VLGLQFSSQTHLRLQGRVLWPCGIISSASSPHLPGLLPKALQLSQGLIQCKEIVTLLRREGVMFGIVEKLKTQMISQEASCGALLNSVPVETAQLPVNPCYRPCYLPCWPGTQWPIVQPGVRSYRPGQQMMRLPQGWRPLFQVILGESLLQSARMKRTVRTSSFTDMISMIRSLLHTLHTLFRNILNITALQIQDSTNNFDNAVREWSIFSRS